MFDNNSYYNRNNAQSKQQLIFDYVKKNDIKTLFDVGCNIGMMSYPIQKKLNVEVFGVDGADKLALPKDYNYEQCDILDYNKIISNDITLFLSVYHHIFGAKGEFVADDLFLKLLLRTDKLIFDTGNMSEHSRQDHPWFKAMSSYYTTEDQLLRHFGIDYEKIGSWNCGGGSRSIVVFDKNSFDTAVTVVDEFERHIGSDKQHLGLVSVKDGQPSHTFKHTMFHKLKLGNRIFFAKKNFLPGYDDQEFEHIKTVYEEINPAQLIKFYGISNKYGLIFEWLDDFTYVGKTHLKLESKTLTDVDQLLINDEIIFSDFER